MPIYSSSQLSLFACAVQHREFELSIDWRNQFQTPQLQDDVCMCAHERKRNNERKQANRLDPSGKGRRGRSFRYRVDEARL
jgi:hypothetical protein